MKAIFFLLLGLTVSPLFAQPTISKTLPLRSGQSIRMNFDYPKLIRVSTWTRNEILVECTVSINSGENNDAFKLITSTEGGSVQISNQLNLKDIPRRITVVKDGQKLIFKDKGALRKYQEENGRNFDQMNDGADLDILIEVKVPANTETTVESTYGLVEVKSFNGPISVRATYGGIDVSLNENSIGELNAETNYGHIYSDLDLKFTGDRVREEDFHTVVSARPGSGPRVNFESPYGNVYLRKIK